MATPPLPRPILRFRPRMRRTRLILSTWTQVRESAPWWSLIELLVWLGFICLSVCTELESIEVINDFDESSHDYRYWLLDRDNISPKRCKSAESTPFVINRNKMDAQRHQSGAKKSTTTATNDDDGFLGLSTRSVRSPLTTGFWTSQPQLNLSPIMHLSEEKKSERSCDNVW